MHDCTQQHTLAPLRRRGNKYSKGSRNRNAQVLPGRDIWVCVFSVVYVKYMYAAMHVYSCVNIHKHEYASIICMDTKIFYVLIHLHMVPP